MSVRLMSWNIQWCRGADGRVQLSRTLAEICAAEADVVCLQEVAQNFPGLADNNRDDQVALIARAMPGYSAHFAAASDLPEAQGGRSTYGNMLLSRLPVGQVFRHSLPWPADTSVPSMQRVCLEAVIELPGAPLRLLTTHLEYYAVAQRMAQVAALRRILAEGHALSYRPPAAKDSNPAFAPPARGREAILCGDFNFQPASAEYRRLLRRFPDTTPALRDAWRVCHGRSAHAHTVGLHGAEWPDFPYCCDFAFVTPAIAARLTRCEVRADTAASDHQPLIIEWH